MAMPFWDISEAKGDRVALITETGQNISYNALFEQADLWKDKLLAAADGKRMVVALEIATSVECIAAYLGTLRSGLPLLLAEPGQLTPDSRLIQIWAPELRILSPKDSTQGPVFETHLDGAPTDNRPHEDLRLLLSTSGSTGDPKLVRLSGENIDSNAQSIAEYLNITPSDCAATTLPLYYSYGMSVLNSYLAAGASLFLTDRSVTEAQFWESCTEHKVTSLALVPHQFDLLDHSGFTGAQLPSLRYITQAGGKLPAVLVRQFNNQAQSEGWDLVVMYGQTEAAPRISYVPPADLVSASDTIGCPVPGGKIWLADEDGKPIEGAGIQGELVYEGPNVMMGYGETRPDLARGHEQSDLRTGDIAERTDAGYFRITGRLKRFVKLYGLRLSLDQIEAELRSHDIAAHAVAVDDHLVLLHRDKDQGPAAANTVADAYELPADGICCEYLSELPLLSSGKPDQRALREIAGVALVQFQETQANTRAGELPSALIQRLTRTSNADMSLSFLDLGGNSLSYLEVQMALEKRLGVVPEGWEEMALQKLDALQPVAGADPSKSRVGIDVILRLAAIMMVVAQHASDYPLYGGTWILITLMGFSAARFQTRLIREGQSVKLGAGLLYPIIPLYFALMFSYLLLRGPVPLEFLTLVGNYYIFPEAKLLAVYWFISLYAQLVLMLVVIAAVPSLRSLASAMPWRFFAVIGSVAAISGALLLLQEGYVYHGERVSHVADFPVLHITGRSLLECLPIFAIGWMMATMKSRMQIALTLALSVLTLVNFAQLGVSPEATYFLALSWLLLLADITVPLPVLWGRLIQQLAAVTLYVYLTHQIIVTVFRYWLQFPDHFAVPVSLTVSFAVAFALKTMFERGEQLVQQSKRVRRASSENAA